MLSPWAPSHPSSWSRWIHKTGVSWRNRKSTNQLKDGLLAKISTFAKKVEDYEYKYQKYVKMQKIKDSSIKKMAGMVKHLEPEPAM